MYIDMHCYSSATLVPRYSYDTLSPTAQYYSDCLARSKAAPPGGEEIESRLPRLVGVCGPHPLLLLRGTVHAAPPEMDLLLLAISQTITHCRYYPHLYALLLMSHY
jgi:hypothetical protein